MAFFPPEWVPSEPPEPDPRGWAAYVAGGLELPDVPPVRLASDVVLTDFDRARIWIPAVEGYPDAMTFEVRCELPEAFGGEELRDLMQAPYDGLPGAAPPHRGLLVGLALADGSALRTYAVGPDDHGVRLRRRSGGGSSEPGRRSILHETYGVPVRPSRPFDVVCSLEAVGVVEARAAVDPAPRP